MSLSKIVAQGVRNPFSAPDKQHMLYSAQNWYWCNISSTSFFFFALLKTTVVTFSKKQSLIGDIEVDEQNALIITKRKTSVFTESQRRRKLYSHSLIETVAKVSQQLAHVTGQSQLLHFENKVLRKIALLIIEEHEPGRKIQNI